MFPAVLTLVIATMTRLDAAIDYSHSSVALKCKGAKYTFIGDEYFHIAVAKDAMGKVVANTDDLDCEAKYYINEDVPERFRGPLTSLHGRMHTRSWMFTDITCGSEKCDIETAVKKCNPMPSTLQVPGQTIYVMASILITMERRQRQNVNALITLNFQHSIIKTARLRYTVDSFYTTVTSPHNITALYGLSNQDLVRIAELEMSDFPLCLYYVYENQWIAKYFNCHTSLPPLVDKTPPYCGNFRHKPYAPITFVLEAVYVQWHTTLVEFPTLSRFSDRNKLCRNFLQTVGLKCNDKEVCIYDKCVCVNGQERGKCHLDADECKLLNNKCSNESVCVNTPTSYTCKCNPGITGKYCRSDIDECLDTPCKNKGTCINSWKSYRCLCVAGYTGQNCEYDIDECASHPCTLGSTCINLVNSYECKCPPSKTGRRCEVPVDLCAKKNCSRYSTCSILADESVICQCSTLYTGPTCEDRINICEGSNPCLHGICTPTDTGYTCTCNKGFYGSNCTLETDECASNPCGQNGQCVDLVDGYSCDCHSTYSGKNCEIPPTFCDTVTCMNGGSCRLEPAGALCSCPTNFQGDYCEQQYDFCENHFICGRGDCVLENNGYRCICQTGYTGNDCSKRLTPCVGVKCKNGGKCEELNDGSYTCHCPEGTSGKNCEVKAGAAINLLHPLYVFAALIVNSMLQYYLNN